VQAPGTLLQKVTKAAFMVVEVSSQLLTVLLGSRMQGRLAGWVNPIEMSFDDVRSHIALPKWAHTQGVQPPFPGPGPRRRPPPAPP
jgi:hypothetical protein